MKRVIFTCYDDIKKEKLTEADNVSQNQLAEYFERLVDNKKIYAEKIGVDFILYHNTMKDFSVDTELEFTKVNLYKHHLLDKLCDEYDEVMYVDMDVVFNTDKNVFEKLPLKEGIHFVDQDSSIISKDIKELLFKKIGLRNPTLKYHITKDLLDGQDNHVTNTGIIIGKSEHLKQIKLVERLPNIIKKIEKLKNQIGSTRDPVYLRSFYYPNNESVFSYIIEKYNIPYRIMNRKWHTIVDHIPVEKQEAEIYHFINKNFCGYFQDKTKAIFSIYIKIEDENLDNPANHKDDPVPKSKQTQIRLEKYKDKLQENKVQYAKAINANYILFERDNQYESFKERFSDLSEYDVINLYKIYLLDELTKKYDSVLYLDYDVVILKNIDFFDYVPVQNAIGCYYSTAEDHKIPKNNINYFKGYRWDFRSPHSKYWNAHALLSEENIDPENVVFNTGIIGASRKMMERLDYFSDIEEVISRMKELKEDSIYPPKVQAVFGYDNETIFSYKVKKNKVPIHQFDNDWHYKHSYRNKEAFTKGTSSYHIDKQEFEAGIREHNTVFAHFISKNFGLVFDK
jgi:lipopolysaccharide biosynthesis glycosyltransferase